MSLLDCSIKCFKKYQKIKKELIMGKEDQRYFQMVNKYHKYNIFYNKKDFREKYNCNIANKYRSSFLLKL